MRANIMAGRALSLYAASQLDIMHFHPDADAKKRAEQLIALLIPVQKAYCTDRGFEACVTGQQVLGGHGYVREWGLEQNVRDARIAQIYEGTNGVQALDLAGRKTARCNGALLQLLIEEWDAFATSPAAKTSLAPYDSAWRKAREHLQQATDWLTTQSKTNPAEIGAASYPYMELMGLNLYSFMWLRILAAAASSDTLDPTYRDGLLKTGQFFFARLLPQSAALLAEIQAGSDTLMSLTAEQF